MTIRLEARAKLNLSLHIAGRAGDFHRITSLMQSLALADRLECEAAESTSLSVDDESLANGANLVWRALAELEAEVGRPLPMAVRLAKRIPVAAGLGGASADAAAVLRAAELLYGLELEAGRRLAVARRVGSDVPFALRGGTAFVAGTGEEVVPLAFLGDLEVLLAVPEPPLLTREVYAAWDELAAADPGLRHDDPHGALGALRPGRAESLARLIHNDLLEPAARRAPRIRAILESWRRVTPLCGMSGSGPTLFALPAGDAEREELERLARRQGARLFRSRFAPSGLAVLPAGRSGQAAAASPSKG
ncbi:MAG: 4-(cytidine 5'-diphospho)-2-C-methyl-D-erythritol kinase [Clostridia bacterium]|nr:4-(cytidine 5'-diphospho)-2-C-methyl-D-erythritol kinase [Clostridia bacterium]MCL6521346.1 4-(cytidine 5'-diphospho)-2-C-methyl-D-erythritol kinase [Bacillota bacterium]